jgi:hypothetical protein
MSFLGRDPSIVKLGGIVLPGLVQSIKGANRKFIWEKQKGTASSGATIIYKGTDIAESIEIVTFAPTLAMQEASVKWNAYVTPAKIGGQPATFQIENVLIEFNKITRVSIAEVKQPDETKDQNVVFVWLLTEYSPPAPAKTGPADPASKGKGGAGGTAKPGDPAIASLQAQAAAAKADFAKAMAKA